MVLMERAALERASLYPRCTGLQLPRQSSAVACSGDMLLRTVTANRKGSDSCIFDSDSVGVYFLY